MNAETPSRTVLNSTGADAAERATELFFDWLLRLPLDVDPRSAARLALAAAPQRPEENLRQRRLRGLLGELCRASDPRPAAFRRRH